ncbi:hypothetical protein HELRODRAFT_190130 [Helobdella robusta]|uniref:GOLD domain-containing protein n=1 Tax=Helobdella robusta TaxID=6412 RepID=T1FRQ1_HELRO|nr:hypothetical protein HELRODRAFT_190130 [Helobdella robusta]ESO10664.1 hypothetical protein HELRODRAFT_190130 [Helobdella robusta]
MLKKDVGLLKEKVIQLLRDKESLWRQCEELKDDKMMLYEQLQQHSSSSHLQQSSSSHSQQSSSLPPSSQKSSLSSSLPPPTPSSSSSSSSSLPAEVTSSALSRLMTSLVLQTSNLYDVICIDEVIEASIFNMKNDETNTFLDVIDLNSYYNQSLTSPSLSQLPESSSSSSSLAQTQSSLSSQPSSSSSSWLVKHLEATAGKIIFLPVRMSRDFIDNLHWSFNTHPKGITFSIVFKDEMTSSLTSSVTPTTSQLSSSSSSSSSSIVTTTATEPSSVQRSSSRHPISTIDIIFPPTKLQSHLKDVVASLVPNKSGMYIFIFDNSFNKVTTKKVNLHLKAVYRPIA